MSRRKLFAVHVKLLHLRGLFIGLHACVPEGYDVYGIIIDAIDQLVQSIDNDTAVGL